MPLVITVPKRELYDEASGKFLDVPSKKLVLEHSLVSISKWESKWHKPYLPSPGIPKSDRNITKEENIDYIRCMTINNDVDPVVYYGLTSNNYKTIQSYINDPMTATTITNNKKKGKNEVITSELIYYWMTALNIPFQPCEKWHLNRLLMLIEVCALKNEQPKKMSPQAVMRQNHAANMARRARHNSRG